MKGWFKRQKRITWWLVFVGVATIDLPFYLIHPWIMTEGWRGLYYAMKFGSLILGYGVADYVRSKL